MLAPGTVIGGYRVHAMLGRGTTAVVYEAVDVSETRVALKVALPGMGDGARFQRGARAQARLEHPAIVGVVAAGEDAAHGPWLAMELVEGPTLAELHANGMLSSPRALRLLKDVAAALDFAHAAGVVHRDVKPSNVLVEQRTDQARLADFGLARDGDDLAHTRTGAVIGTLPYLAPELVRGGRPSAAGDRYALAAIAYELLVGEAVFPRPSDAAVLYAHVGEPVPKAGGRRPELPKAVDGVLQRGLAKSPGERFADATRFVAALDAALRGHALGAPARRRDSAAETVEPHRPRLRPRWALGGAAGLAALLAAVVLSITLGGEGSGPAKAATPPAGHITLGSALDAPHVTGRDCRDQAPSGSSPSCTLLQTELAGRQLVVPKDGAVRAWTVRGARGELVLQVLRRRDGKIFQVVRSQPALVTEPRQRLEAKLPARAGDVIGLALLPGARVGVAPDAPGAATERWTDPVSADRGAGETDGFAHEVQLQVDFEPGALIPPPAQVTGERAATLAPGREIAAGDVRLPDGRRVRVALVEVGRTVHVDLYRGDGVRRARILVHDLVAGGTVVEFKPFESPGNPSQLNVAYRNAGTRSDISHYFGLDAEALEYYS